MREIGYELQVSRNHKTTRTEFFHSMTNAIKFAEQLMKAQHWDQWEDISDKVYQPSANIRLWRSDDFERITIEPINWRD